MPLDDSRDLHATPSGYDLTVWCHRCGARTEIRIDHDQLSLDDVPCAASCGAVGSAAIHWPLGRTEPVVVFDEESELDATDPTARGTAA